jgi:hypothetical protein
LYRETPEFVKSINVTLDEKERYYMDIPEFSDAVMENLRPIPPGDNVSMRGAGRNAWHIGSLDYIFMCFMLGNDFMPHFPALNIRTTGIATLMDAYRAVFNPDESIIQATNPTTITTTTTTTPSTTTQSPAWSINWPNYKRFVDHLAAQELTLIRKEHATRDRQSRYMRDTDKEDDVMHDVLMLPMTQREVERQINPFELGWERRYYASLCDIHTKTNDEPIAALCRNY